MKINFFRLSLILFTFLLLIGCSKKEGDNNSFIPPQKEQLKQSAYADNESTGDGFTFTANTSWTATVKEVHPKSSVSPQTKSEAPTADDSGNSVAWLKIYNGTQEAYSGGPGTVTLRIEVEQNYTGERREATITIRCGNNTFIVTVVQEGTKQDGKENEPPVKVTKITLNETKLSLKVGDKVTLTATVEPANATIKSVSWSSSNTNVATVNPATGEIVAIAEGTATIIATSTSNKEVSGICAITVSKDTPIVPDKYAYVSKINRTIKYWDQVPEEEQYEDEVTYMFDYDNSNRVSSYNINIWRSNDPHQDDATHLVSTIDYSKPGNLIIKEQWDDGEPEIYEIPLNEKGYILQAKVFPYYPNSHEYYTCKIEYNDEDRISNIKSIETDWDGEYYEKDLYNILYKDGVISNMTYYSDSYDGGKKELSGFEKYFGTIPNNKLNLDINMLFMLILPEEIEKYGSGGDVPGFLGRLALLRLAGCSMDCYITSSYLRAEPGVANTPGIYGYPNPGEVIHKSFEYFIYKDNENVLDNLKYVFNENGTVASVTIDKTIVKIKKEFDIVVGNELVNPNKPKDGYRYEIKNKKETELGRGTNSFVYTFTYR